LHQAESGPLQNPKPLARARQVTRKFVIWRSLEAVIGGATGRLLFGALDSGHFRGHLPAGVFAIGVAFVALVIATVAVVRLIRVGLDMEDLQWFPERSAVGGSRGVLALVAFGLVITGTALAASAWLPDAAWRVALGGVGVFLGYLAVGRPRGFWEAPSIRDLRQTVGDIATSLVYGALGLASLLGAILL